MTPRPDWHLEAACRAHPEPDLWHGDATGATGRRITARAKAVCRMCPVELTCLAEHFGEPHGIWGGMTGDERRALRRGPRTPAPTSEAQPTPRPRRTLAPHRSWDEQRLSRAPQTQRVAMPGLPPRSQRVHLGPPHRQGVGVSARRNVRLCRLCATLSDETAALVVLGGSA